MLQVKDLKKHFTGAGIAPALDQRRGSSPRQVTGTAEPTITGAQVQELLGQLRHELESRIVEVSERQAKQVLSERGESDTLLEGRANAFTVQIESKMQQ